MKSATEARERMRATLTEFVTVEFRPRTSGYQLALGDHALDHPQTPIAEETKTCSGAFPDDVSMAMWLATKEAPPGAQPKSPLQGSLACVLKVHSHHCLDADGPPSPANTMVAVVGAVGENVTI